MARKSTSVAVVEKEEQVFPTGVSSNNLEVQQAASELITLACKRIGMGLDDYLTAVKDGLVATKTTVDKYGDEHVEVDHATRLKAATMGLEVEGYMKKASGVSVSVAVISTEERELMEAYRRGE